MQQPLKKEATRRRRKDVKIVRDLLKAANAPKVPKRRAKRGKKTKRKLRNHQLTTNPNTHKKILTITLKQRKRRNGNRESSDWYPSSKHKSFSMNPWLTFDLKQVEKMQNMVSLVRPNDPRWNTWSLAPYVKTCLLSLTEF